MCNTYKQEKNPGLKRISTTHAPGNTTADDLQHNTYILFFECFMFILSVGFLSVYTCAVWVQRFCIRDLQFNRMANYSLQAFMSEWLSRVITKTRVLPVSLYI